MQIGVLFILLVGTCIAVKLSPEQELSNLKLLRSRSYGRNSIKSSNSSSSLHAQESLPKTRDSKKQGSPLSKKTIKK
jgi:hypothetical protein